MESQTTKTAFLFPGQGVLPHEICEFYLFLKGKNEAKTGAFLATMQKSLDEINPEAKFKIVDILADEASPSWEKTSFVQPLLYTLSTLTFELLQQKPAYVLGHSLGAYSALTASGAMPFAVGTTVVAARGKFMQEDSEKTDNRMLAIIGLTEDNVRKICEEFKIVIALLNGPTAFVVGGPKDIFPEVEKRAAVMGARKTFALATSGPFHTAWMQESYEKLKDFMKDIRFETPEIAVVTNMGGKASTDPEELKNDVLESCIHPVNWMRMMEFLKSHGVDLYVEVGAGNSLSALARINGVEREKIHQVKELLG